ncbi:hypothetical protein [Pseudomonas eucalypticola]|uniref:Uncharacterized protein n=1 Tax=Pseudomonas eucalypticola TaxID=2599595 RepID=A0A7D5D6S3_9PSED|nr:hypothetical protein [Pseudomonas eucalypticola]QKZ04213.1 hypothetical protein HWQ56_10630 [Pseudomonas eucalypticola]
MVSLKTDYHPIEVALHWCNLANHATEILAVAFYNPDKLLRLFPQWPSLHAYTERIYDAILCGELPAWYLGRQFRPDSDFNRAYLTVRRPDLRGWVARDYPDDLPAFLFECDALHVQCVSLGAHLAQKSELEATARELQNVRQTLAIRTAELESQIIDLQAVIDRMDLLEEPSNDSSLMHYLIIGALLAISAGKSPEGQVQSIYKDQSTIVAEILRRFANIRGLSKRSLDRKFAQARRCLKQAE